MAPTLYTCFERQAISIPSEKFLGAAGEVELDPSVLGKGYFDIDFRGGSLTLVAGKHIGIIPLSSRIILDVRPKLPIRNLVELLNRSGQFIGSLDYLLSAAQIADSQVSLTELLCNTFLHQMRPLATEGLWKEYFPYERHGFFKPRVSFNKSIQRYWAKGIYTRTVSDVFVFSRCTPENKLIKQAITVCAKRLMEIGRLTPEAIDRLSYFENLLESIPVDDRLSFIADAKFRLGADKIPDIRNYYRDLVRTALLLVEGQGVDLGSPGDASVRSSIINLETAFESYIRKTLQNLLGYDRVVDGNQTFLRLLHDSKEYQIKPDIQILAPSTIIEVKYKQAPSEVDRYQVLCHAQSLGASTAILLLPAEEGEETGLQRIGQVFDKEGIVLYEYRFSMNGDLDEAEMDLAESLSTLNIHPPLSESAPH